MLLLVVIFVSFVEGGLPEKMGKVPPNCMFQWYVGKFLPIYNRILKGGVIP